MTARMKEKYKTEVADALRKSRGYVNAMQVPRFTKVVVNVGVPTSVDKDTMKAIAGDLAKITGQIPLTNKARKSIANFKLREGMPIGLKVTLRGDRMYEFLDRLINIALPRIRDFRGVPATSFDGRGNYSLGLREQGIFPEIDPDNIKTTHGMDVTIVTTAQTDDEARELLKMMGMPFATAQ
ncbi:MAG: 50S ribosomal protein L5 [Spartobacteria bacterium]|nr:50S ribosomal protein L5 [Spartobacteria bacterium]